MFCCRFDARLMYHMKKRWDTYDSGFVLRYPTDKTAATGVAPEEWHYRYVGVEAATEMYEQGLCLEEYLEQLK